MNFQELSARFNSDMHTPEFLAARHAVMLAHPGFEGMLILNDQPLLV